jgi:hypothetical protein
MKANLFNRLGLGWYISVNDRIYLPALGFFLFGRSIKDNADGEQIVNIFRIRIFCF